MTVFVSLERRNVAAHLAGAEWGKPHFAVLGKGEHSALHEDDGKIPGTTTGSTTLKSALGAKRRFLSLWADRLWLQSGNGLSTELEGFSQVVFLGVVTERAIGNM